MLVCEICNEIEGLPPQLALHIIGVKLLSVEGRVMSRHLSQVMDRILDTEVEGDVNHVAEEAAFRAMSRGRHDSEE